MEATSILYTKKSKASINCQLAVKSFQKVSSSIPKIKKKTGFETPSVTKQITKMEPQLIKIGSKTNYKELSDQEIEQQADFLIQTIEKGVGQLSNKKLKKFKKVCQTTIASCVSMFTLATPAFAEAMKPLEETANMLMPDDIVKIGLYLIAICATASTVLAIILLQLAGGYRMLRKGKDATEWTTDILKGFSQVLLAPVLIVTIALVIYLLFGDFQFFVKPF